MSIVVFVNSRSRANRKNPERARGLADILGDTGGIVAPASLDELGAKAREMPARRPSVIGIHGGDGTLHRTISALLLAYGSRPLPPVAVLPGGTMNVVASSLGITVSPERLLGELAQGVRQGAPPTILPRRCIKVQDGYGFVFGTGLVSNFLEEYYAGGNYGAGRAARILGRGVLSEMTTKRYSRHLFRRFRSRIAVDDQVLPWGELLGVLGGTVREVGLGFKLNHRADDHPDRFGVLAIHGSPLSLLRDLGAVRSGAGVSPRRAWSEAASRLVIEPEERETSYTIDGDLYRTQGAITVEAGPTLSFVRPRGC